MLRAKMIGSNWVISDGASDPRDQLKLEIQHQQKFLIRSIIRAEIIGSTVRLAKSKVCSAFFQKVIDVADIFSATKA